MIEPEKMKEISEKMGEAVHNAWMEKRKKEKGWHSPEECPSNRDSIVEVSIDHKPSSPRCPQCHPCMRPYKDLPESEKELDRQYPELFFKILEEMSYKVSLTDPICDKCCHYSEGCDQSGCEKHSMFYSNKE